jgi:vacuolar protein sorting-associated protein 13A/C
MSSRERLDVNLSSTFVELAISMATTLSAQGDRLLRKARGGDAPYRIRNLTGGPLNVWSDYDGSQSGNHAPAVKILQSEMVDWRFDDWRTMREVSCTPAELCLI